MTTEQPRPLLPTVPGSFILIDGELKPSPPRFDPGVREWLVENGGFFDAPTPPPPPPRAKISKTEVEPITTLDDVVGFLEGFGLDDELEKNGETKKDIVSYNGSQEWHEGVETNIFFYESCFYFVYESVIVWTKKRVYFLVHDSEDWLLVSGPRNP